MEMQTKRESALTNAVECWNYYFIFGAYIVIVRSTLIYAPSEGAENPLFRGKHSHDLAPTGCQSPNPITT